MLRLPEVRLEPSTLSAGNEPSVICHRSHAPFHSSLGVNITTDEEGKDKNDEGRQDGPFDGHRRGRVVPVVFVFPDAIVAFLHHIRQRPDGTASWKVRIGWRCKIHF